jgi:hypothetical protein
MPDILGCKNIRAISEALSRVFLKENDRAYDLRIPVSFA